jgi:glycerophosphoryl diester phosphodiesterase
VTPLAVPPVIGHRGARSTAPENTLAGIRQAARDGATWVEFDVKLTADGYAILMHDDTLERTTTGQGPVRQMALHDIRQLDAGYRFAPEWRGEKVPTLSEALQLLAELGMGFNLEVKPCPGREAETARAAVADVEACWPTTRPAPLFSSFKPASLQAVREAAPGLALAYLADELAADWRTEVGRFGCRAVNLNWRRLTRAHVAEVKSAGYALLVWTVNEPPRACELLSWGADGIITDCPAAVLGAIQAQAR